MDNDIQRLRELRARGLCCAQLMVQLGLEARQEEAPALVQAAAGLCGGLHSGLLCGALSGAACLLSLFDRDLAKKELIPRLTDWFRQEYPQGPDCAALLEGDSANKPRVCPPLIEKVYCQARDILEDQGFDLRSAFEREA